MTARQAYEEAERRLAEVEARIEAIRRWQISITRWEQGEQRTAPPDYPGGDLAALLIERERLQEESFRAFRRACAGGV